MHSKIHLFLAMFFLVVLFFPLDTMVVRPGATVSLQDRVDVVNGNTKQPSFFISSSEHVYMYNEKGSLLLMALAEVDFEPQMTGFAGYDKSLLSSYEIAKINAYRALGHDVSFAYNGVFIDKIAAKSQFEGQLFVGDRITDIYGVKIKDYAHLEYIISSFVPGEYIEFGVVRGGEYITIKQKLTSYKTGIYASDMAYIENEPYTVRISLDDFHGSSAGVMLGLEVYQQLTREDIVGDKKISGTGLLSIDGKVLPVDDIIEKLESAIEVETEYFIVPKGTYIPAIYKDKIHIIYVETFDEALAAVIAL